LTTPEVDRGWGKLTKHRYGYEWETTLTRKTIPTFLVGGLLLASCSSPPPPLEVTLHAAEFRYEPGTIQAQVGQDVTVALANIGTLEHDFVILEIPMAQSAEQATEMAEHDMGSIGVDPDIHLAAMPGLNADVTFTPTESGTYEFYCAVPGHREAGMVGTLIVVER
jgi:uncharacterized cupredoxin-like copper-binding protein